MVLLGCSRFFGGRGLSSSVASGGLLACFGLRQHPHDVALFHDQVLDAVDLDLGARPFAEQHPIADLDVDRNELAGFVAPSRSTATTLPSCGFSLAVSGMMMPPAVFASASIRVSTTRS